MFFLRMPSFKYILLIVSLLALTATEQCLGIPVDEYMELRASYFQKEEEHLLGSNIVFNALEAEVNNILMSYKQKEFNEGLEYENGEYFPAARHFFHSKPTIEGSNVFKIIKMLPKGAALHMHDFTVASSDFVALNISKWEHLYYCISGPDEHLLLHFFPNTPDELCPDLTAQWRLVSDLRKASSSSEYIDNYLRKSMSMVTNTPDVDYPNADRAWYFFEKKITTISGAANYEPAFREVYIDTLKNFFDDNVQYIEMRGLFDGVYRSDGSLLSPLEVIGLYQDATSEFLGSYPTFWGAKTIYAPHRFNTNSNIKERLEQSVEMKQTFPDFFAGFDLVGQEDKGGPLVHFINELLEAAEKGVKFFFHAGETDWYGTQIDENVFDALLLNTSRIGHGYAIAHYQYLMDIVEEKQIGIEVCPVSNQVLGLVNDLRNHPAAKLMKKDFPIVIASDGPGIWGSVGLSHDWYYAFMDLGGQKADLRTLKQLALNSIKYSAMSEIEKTDNLIKWEVLWNNFLNDVVAEYGGETEPRTRNNNIMSNEIPN